MRTMAAVVLGLGVVGIVGLAGAQEEPEPVSWEVESSAAQVAPGDKVTVKVTAALEFGWHIYSLTQAEGGPTPTAISVPSGQPFSLAGKVGSDKPDSKFDENFGIQVEQHEESVTFTVPVSVGKVDSSTKAIKVNALYQACTASVCLPPQTAELSVAVTVKK